MESRGIMEEIRELLAQGKSTREIITMGYRPGSVYGTLRRLRSGQTLPRKTVTGRTREAETGGARLLAPRGADLEPELWHAEPPIRCPGCGKPVVHWLICPLCSRLFPADCACPKTSPSRVDGYSFYELQEAGHR